MLFSHLVSKLLSHWIKHFCAPMATHCMDAGHSEIALGAFEKV